MKVVLLKTIIFTFVVPGTVTVLIPWSLLSSGSARPPLQLGPFRYFGIVFIAIGAAIYFWCAWEFTFAGRGTPAPIDPPKKLVARGLYRYVRNPMYVGVSSILVGEAMWFASVTLFLYAATVFIMFFLFVVLYEEPALSTKFGESYKDYCRNVGRWVPRRSKK